MSTSTAALTDVQPDGFFTRTLAEADPDGIVVLDDESGRFTIGSPRMLKLVLTMTGHPVRS